MSKICSVFPPYRNNYLNQPPKLKHLLINFSDWAPLCFTCFSWVPVYTSKDQRLAIMSIGFLLNSRDDAVVWRGPKKNGRQTYFCFLVRYFFKSYGSFSCMVLGNYNNYFAFANVRKFLKAANSYIGFSQAISFFVISVAMIKQFLSDVCWGDLDYLIIDTPPGTGKCKLIYVMSFLR